MAKYLVCVSDERHASYEIERAILEKAGAELKLCHCESAADIAAQCADADAVLLDLAPMTAEAVAGLRKCKVISRYGEGQRLRFCRGRGIRSLYQRRAVG